VLESDRLDARHRETRRCRQEHEVAGLQGQGTVAMDGQVTGALKHDAEARLAEGGVAESPATRGAVAPREHRAAEAVR
jgi:hypothetical protein